MEKVIACPQLIEYMMIACQGRENAQTQYQIAGAINMSPREIRRIMNNMRGQSILICSTPHKPAGYYIPTELDQDDTKKYIERLKSQALNIMKLLKPQMAAYNRLYPNEQLKFNLEV
jgi:hypothetical protein